MRKLLIISFLLVAATVITNAQTKPGKQANKPPASVKPDVYKKVVTVDLSDLQVLIEGLSNWKILSIYDPNKSSDEKVKLYQELEKYSKDLILKTVGQKGEKIDSVLVQ